MEEYCSIHANVTGIKFYPGLLELHPMMHVRLRREEFNPFDSRAVVVITVPSLICSPFFIMCGNSSCTLGVSIKTPNLCSSLFPFMQFHHNFQSIRHHSSNHLNAVGGRAKFLITGHVQLVISIGGVATILILVCMLQLGIGMQKKVQKTV